MYERDVDICSHTQSTIVDLRGSVQAVDLQDFIEGPKISTAGGSTSEGDLAFGVVERYFVREMALGYGYLHTINQSTQATVATLGGRPLN